jgi:hypothetical protein
MKNFDSFRVGFYITKEGSKQWQVINLDGYWVNAFASIGVEQKDVPAFIRRQLSEWSAFDSTKPITKQVKALIMLSIVDGLGGDVSYFLNKGENDNEQP